MALPRYRANNTPKPSGSSPSPAPASGASKTPSGGGGSSGKSGNGIIGYFLIPTILATLWLVIRGVVSPPTHYSNIEIGIFIIVFVLTAINILFGKGASKWISLVLVVVMGCIIWGNYNYINSSNATKNTSTEQSAGQEQVATAPATVEEEEISKEPILPKSNNPILLTKSGYYNTIKGKYRLCFSWLGDEEDGGSRINQSIKINDVEFNSRGSNCYPYKSEGKIYVEFINPTQTPNDSYSYYKKRVGGQGIYPFLELVK